MTFSTKQMNIKRNPTVIFENVNRHNRYWKLEHDCKTLKKNPEEYDQTSRTNLNNIFSQLP
jgi:hypothetical protein